MKTKVAEVKNSKERTENTKEFAELVWILAKLPPEGLEKVAIYTMGILAMA